MKFSIVTISYNQSEFLRQCIESVLSQEVAEIEYIVVDPGSTDGSREIIDEYADQIIRVYDPDDGPADGLNKGFSRATGEICAFINSDDYFLPGAFKAVEKHFESTKPEHFITGHGFQIRGGRLWPMVPVKLSMKRLRLMHLPIFQQGTFFPLSFLQKAGGFNVRNRTCWDGELFLKFIQMGFTHYVMKDILAVFRVHEGSISGKGANKDQFLKDRGRIYDSVLGFHESEMHEKRRKIFGYMFRARYLLRLSDLLQWYFSKSVR